MLLKIDHRERAGEYTYEFEARGTNTCTFTAPLGNAQPVCDLQGPSVKVRTDDKGITSFNATASAWDTEGSHWFRATRDGEVIYDSALDPNWGPHHGDGGCHLYDLGTATVSF